MSESAAPAEWLFGMRRSGERSRTCCVFLGLLLLLGGAALWRLLAGDMEIPFSGALRIVLGFEHALTPQQALVIRAVRLPRLLASLGAGASLAVSGVVLQGILVNPLAEPYTLGIASGAALGASLGIFLGGAWIPAAAFAGALAALSLSLLLAWRSGGFSPLHMVLSGIVIGSVLSAGVTLLKALAGERVAAIVLWLMGSFSGASSEGAFSVAAGAFALFAAAWWWGRDLDAISLGENRAVYLGVEERRIKGTLLVLASLATALTVASHGIIGFVGLVGPHLLRMALGPSHRVLLTASFLGGALLLTVADGVARSLGELPVGVVTSLAGGPVFCWILLRGRERV